MTTNYSRIHNAFTAGELSPRLDGRTDTDQYYKGLKTLKNFYVHTHGGVSKRPGTKYMATAGDSNNPVRLIPFEVSTTQAYVLELGDSYARFFVSSGQVATSAGTIYEISTPYAGTDIFDLKFVQSADVMYLAHEDYPPYKLTRTGHTNWTLEEVTFYGGPFFDLNTTSTTIKPTATTGTIEITASSALFDTDHVDAFWKFENSQVVSKDVDAENTFSDYIIVDAGDEFEFDVDGTWNATVTLQHSWDEGDTWVDHLAVTENTSVHYTETRDNVYWRAGIKTGDYTTGTAEIKLTLIDYYGYAKITSFTSSTEVSATVIKELPSTDTTANWAEGAWSEYRGYPNCTAFYEQRLLFAGSPARPQTIWGSQTDDFENFENTNNLDAEAYTYQVASQDVNTIQWMLDHSRVLLFGTHSGEWKFGDTDTATTATFVNIKKQTPYGSNSVQAIPIDRFALYIQRGGKKVRSMGYDLRYDGFLSPDVSLLSEHLFNDGIKDLSYVSNPDPIVYMVDNAGDIVVLTLDPNASVTAFSQWTTDGDFESVTSIPNSAGIDELWTVVKRNINDTDYRYIEKFKINEIVGTDYSDVYYLDSGIEGSFPNGTYTVTGATHLIGESVKLFIDGAVQADSTVTSAGSITFSTSGNQVITGLGYDAVLETMKLELPKQSGTGQGKPMNTYRVVARLQDTVGLKAGDNTTTQDIIPFRSSAMLMNQPVPLYNGDKEIFLDTGWKSNQEVVIVSDQPLPCTILAVIIDIQSAEY